MSNPGPKVLMALMGGALLTLVAMAVANKYAGEEDPAPPAPPSPSASAPGPKLTKAHQDSLASGHSGASPGIDHGADQLRDALADRPGSVPSHLVVKGARRG